LFLQNRLAAATPFQSMPSDLANLPMPFSVSRMVSAKMSGAKLVLSAL
jgi:hypothetical protein